MIPGWWVDLLIITILVSLAAVAVVASRARRPVLIDCWRLVADDFARHVRLIPPKQPVA